LSEIKLIFAHQEVRGAKLGALVSEIEEDWPLEAPLVISGHIHEYQEVQKNWIYPGTPFTHAFGDSNDKAVMLVSFKDDAWIYERLNLKLPGKILKHLTVKELRSMLDQSWQPEEYLSYKFKVSGKKTEIQSVKQHLNYGFLKGVKVVFEYTDNAPIVTKSLNVRPYVEIVLERLKQYPLAISYFEDLLRDTCIT
jgi:DNA repair exonuclease SbcCD nuclease subunit